MNKAKRALRKHLIFTQTRIKNRKDMITGRNSALIGMGLLMYILLTILVLIGCCLASGLVFTIVGIVNSAINAWIATSVYKIYSNKN